MLYKVQNTHAFLGPYWYNISYCFRRSCSDKSKYIKLLYPKWSHCHQVFSQISITSITRNLEDSLFPTVIFYFHGVLEGIKERNNSWTLLSNKLGAKVLQNSIWHLFHHLLVLELLVTSVWLEASLKLQSCYVSIHRTNSSECCLT